MQSLDRGPGITAGRKRKRENRTIVRRPVTLYIVRRETRTRGVRWHVRFQHRRVNGGAIVHLGVFDTERRAKARLRAAKDELAQGRVPQRFSGTLDAPEYRTLAETAEAWLATRHDVARLTMKGYRHSVATIPAWLGESDPDALTHVEVQRFVTELAARFKRGTLENDLGVIRQVLDYAGVEPNPARDRRVKLPRAERRDYRLPTLAQLAGMHAAMPSRVPLMILLEHTGLRVEEAAELRWRDIDHARGRLLVRESKTAAGRRFVEHLPGTPAFPEKPEQGADDGSLVFEKPSPASLTGMIRIAHKRHGSFLMSAHDFRHLHASRLLHDGILSPAQIAARLGHANPAITLAVYSHVVPPEG